MKQLVTLSSTLFAFAACGDNLGPAVGPDSSVPPQTDAAIDAPSYVAPAPFAIAISANGPDQIMAAAAGPGDTFYVAGYTAATHDGAKYLFVAKLAADGTLDTGFGTGGIFTSDVEFKGGLDEIDMVVQSTGRIVVAATIANDVDADDRDVGLIGVTAAGALDTTFGVVGVSPGFARVDLSTAHDDNGTLKAPDASRALGLGPNDTLFIHAVSRDMADDATTPRVDTDFTVTKRTATGLPDATYGTAGKFLLDIQESNATAKGMHVLADGSVIAGGYANTPVFNKTQPVLYRLTTGGVLEDSFATDGLFHEIVLAEVTEIYNIAVDGARITTAGYGRASGTVNQWVSLRFDTATGVRSTGFGGATDGAVTLDPSGSNAGNNCRGAVVLPSGKTALFGSSGVAPDRNAALAVLTQTGELDTAYGTGMHTFDLNGDDQWWAGARNGSKVLLAGWKGFATQSASENNDSFGLLLTVE